MTSQGTSFSGGPLLPPGGFGIYLHIPFCLQKCPYCDFNAYALTSIPEREYTAALLAEIDHAAAQPGWQGRTVNTIYFGGGTPSLFSPRSIEQLIHSIASRFPVAENAEISLEANPGSLSLDVLRGFRIAGINRLSLGAQSMSAATLKNLGRLHSPEEITTSIESARHAEFDNVSLDLIYAAPEQQIEDVREDLRAVVSLMPDHISAYGLTVEKGTPFHLRFVRGSLAVPAEDVQAQMMEEVGAFLSSCGFKHYEISNFAANNRLARHNLAYWDGCDYLGIGAGAHSCLAEFQGSRKVAAKRWATFALPAKYMSSACSTGSAVSWHEELTERDLWFEFFFLGLRKIGGVDLARFEELFGIRAEALYRTVITLLTEEDLIIREGSALRLSPRGLLLADSVIENFVHYDDDAVAALGSRVIHATSSELKPEKRPRIRLALGG